MDPAEIDLTFVPVPGDGLHVLTVGSELLIFDEGADDLHLLSPTASLAWSFADGSGSLADFATDLVGELGADPDEVAADLVHLAADLVERGLWHAVDDRESRPASPVAPGTDTVRLVAGRADPGLDGRYRPGDTFVLTVRGPSVELDLRVDDEHLATELASSLVEVGVEVDRSSSGSVRPPPLYSVLIGRPSGPVTGLHVLRRANRPVRRCRHREDLVRIVGAEIVAALDREGGRRPLLDVVGLARDGLLVAVDPLYASVVDDLEPRFRRLGIGRADASLLALGPCDPPMELAALVLRPAADRSLHDPHLGPEARAARLTVRAMDLARGPAGHLSAGSIDRLYRVALTTSVVRVPGRNALRDEVTARLT